jgi:hypothetical protein
MEGTDIGRVTYSVGDSQRLKFSGIQNPPPEPYATMKQKYKKVTSFIFPCTINRYKSSV